MDEDQHKEYAEDRHYAVRSTPQSGRNNNSVASLLQMLLRLIYGTVATLLVARLLASVLAVDRSSALGAWLYTISDPLIAPFSRLFGIDSVLNQSGSRFEIDTLAAIIFYGIITYIATLIISIGAGRSSKPY